MSPEAPAQVTASIRGTNNCVILLSARVDQGVGAAGLNRLVEPHIDFRREQPHPNRPRVVVSVTASADGRVTLNRAATLMEPDAREMWRSLQPPGAERLLAERRSCSKAGTAYASC
jgi:hypothetical protein